MERSKLVNGTGGWLMEDDGMEKLGRCAVEQVFVYVCHAGFIVHNISNVVGGSQTDRVLLYSKSNKNKEQLISNPIQCGVFFFFSILFLCARIFEYFDFHRSVFVTFLLLTCMQFMGGDMDTFEGDLTFISC